jgi:GNAT superfamily N-acetyltransferase
MTTGLRVTPVAGRADERDFYRLPYELYREDAFWVPPLRSQERRRFLTAHNASLRGRWMARFLARRGRRVVGRVAAVEDETFARRWWPGAGFFGFFECGEDPEAASALLETAEVALRRRGRDTSVGPVNLTTHDEVGLLVDGFDSPPMVLSPYNPRRYESFVLGAGYQACREYHSYLWTPEARPSCAVERLLRAERATSDDQLRIRCVDPRNWDEEVRRLHEAYNACFADVWGFVPISAEEFQERAAAFRPFYRPELVQLAERGRDLVGFGLVLPDINQALARAGGRLLPFGWARFGLEMRRVRGVRFLLAGVRPGDTGRGIAVRLVHAAAAAARSLGIRRGELSLVQAGNRPMRHIIEAFGGRPVKTFRLYARDILTRSVEECLQPRRHEQIPIHGRSREEQPVDAIEHAALRVEKAT